LAEDGKGSGVQPTGQAKAAKLRIVILSKESIGFSVRSFDQRSKVKSFKSQCKPCIEISIEYVLFVTLPAQVKLLAFPSSRGRGISTYHTRIMETKRIRKKYKTKKLFLYSRLERDKCHQNHMKKGCCLFEADIVFSV